MKLFIVLLLQVLLFLPFTSHAESGLKGLVTQNHKATSATEAKKAEIKSSYGKLPLYFIKNKGQVDSQVSFYERGAGHATFFTSDGVVLSLTKHDGKIDESARHKGLMDLAVKSAKVTTEAVSLSFVGANAKGKIFAGDNMSGKVNYFVGNDRSK